MADRRRSPEAEDNTRRGPDRGAPKSAARWALPLGILIVIALIGLMVFLHLSGTLGPGVH